MSVPELAQLARQPGRNANDPYARHSAIANLLYRYAERIDAGAFEDVAELFRHATTIAAGGNHRIEGYDGVVAAYHSFTRLCDDGTPRTHHFITNPLIRVDDASHHRGPCGHRYATARR